MKTLTYVLQAITALVMVGATLLMVATVGQGLYAMLAIQFVCFAALAGIFLLQNKIRKAL